MVTKQDTLFAARRMQESGQLLIRKGSEVFTAKSVVNADGNLEVECGAPYLPPPPPTPTAPVPQPMKAAEEPKK